MQEKLILLCAFIFLFLVFICILGFVHIFPFKITHFRNYHSFWMMGTGLKEPDEETILKYEDERVFPYYEPASTQKNKYYYYTGLFDHFKAVSFKVDAEEYQQLLDRYINYFSRFEGLVRISRQSIPDDFFETENLTFLKKCWMMI